MAKLYFRYGAMNSGKSTALLQAAFNYEERDQHIAIAKPEIDTKDGNCVSSRLGVTRQVDFLINAHSNPREQFNALRNRDTKEYACLLIDEAQFLSPQQVDELFKIAVIDKIPVLAYGIRTDFQTVAFPGSRRLLEIAHSLEELKTICRCGRKAIFNARLRDKTFIFDGNQVAIDGVEVEYEALCGACYLTASENRLASNLVA